MTDKIVNGDYAVSEGGGFEQIEYVEEVLQNVSVVLNTQRGAFYPDKNFGSNIKNLSKKPLLEYALNYARQAVDDINGVYIKSAEITENDICFDVLVNSEEGQVIVKFENDI